MTALSRGRFRNTVDCYPRLAHIVDFSCWPLPEVRRSAAYGGTADGFERRATAQFDPDRRFAAPQHVGSSAGMSG